MPQEQNSEDSNNDLATVLCHLGLYYYFSKNPDQAQEPSALVHKIQQALSTEALPSVNILSLDGLGNPDQAQNHLQQNLSRLQQMFANNPVPIEAIRKIMSWCNPDLLQESAIE